MWKFVTVPFYALAENKLDTGVTASSAYKWYN